jgi:mannose-1-phosphate guanylyltransferase/phosphomannomutase
VKNSMVSFDCNCDTSFQEGADMKAVVMAGGEGSRLRPLTINRPKPMVPLVNKPVIAHILDLLKRHGITSVVLTLQYMADHVQDYLGDGSAMGMEINYSIEEVPLGTAGSVKNAQKYLDEPFIVISGDAVTDFDLKAIADYHTSKGAKATLTLYHVPNPLEYGVVIAAPDGRIQEFQEKPSWGQVISDTVNTGIYVLEPDVLDLFEAGKPFDFSKDLFPILLKNGDPLYGYVANGYWCDVGNIQEYIRASSDVLEGRVRLDPIAKDSRGGVWSGEGVEIAPDAQLYGPIYLGDGVKIKGGVVIRGPSVIRSYTIVDNRAQVDRSIVWRNSYVGEGAELRGAIVGRQCNIKSNAVVFEGAVVGDMSTVGERAVIHPNVKIWPEKLVEAGATVKSSIIWGSQGRRVLFGRYGITGQVNVDLTPEYATKLGAAFGATLPKGSIVTINRDPHRSPRMLKRALISGLPSAGVHVRDLRSVPIPVARYVTRKIGASGGLHVRLSPHDARTVDIKFLDSRGLNLSKDAERNIERVFFREDFRRVYLDEIGTIDYQSDVIEGYTADFLATLNTQAIRAARFSIVVDYANAPTSLVLPNILRQLGVKVVELNAAMDESKMSIPPQEFQQSLEQLAAICLALRTNLGARLDVGGEKLFLVDDRGKILPSGVATMAMATLALRAVGGGIAAVPVTVSRTMESVAGQYGGSVIRTKTDMHDVMETATREGVVLAADGMDNYAFPQFQPAVDGMMALAKLLEFLSVQKASLSQITDALPPQHMAVRLVPCPWESKGMVMRLLHERYKGDMDAQIDGVKVMLGNDWVLVLPDPDQPLFRIYAESDSTPAAEDLAGKYARIVESLQK